MPRKYLGERIDRSHDFQRPASLTLTDLDLQNIPELPTHYMEYDDGIKNSNTVEIVGQKGRRISRQFGGTIKLKQRLSSVPELFLHNFNRRQEKTDPKPSVAEGPAMHGAKSHRDRVRQSSSPFLTTAPRPSPPDVLDLTLKTPLMVYPVQFDTALEPMQDAESHYSGKSEGEIIYEEIIKAYSSNRRNASEPASVDSELPRSTARPKMLKKPVTRTMHPFINLADPLADPPFTQFVPVFDEPHDLQENISSPEYNSSGVSDPSSVEEEFSDLGSIVESLVQPATRSQSPHRSENSNDDETYFSAEDVQPLKSSAHCSMRKLRRLIVTPKIVAMEDLVTDSQDDSDQRIEQEVQDLEINDASSSVYDL
ncbi:LAMI_0A04632g1_1 [Lachancea mirantina]|uniref:LAMI_0A04632g1_1 n=1 Tax=Lachancea mirantina TaxID=1230905 RepID=A0A1G4IP67_9SACH|nr:LAMI_0A04632g1_1 [Lachancea mirantina]